MLCGLAAPALGAPYVDDAPSWEDVTAPGAPSGAVDRALDFDIPAQPLATALQRYALISSRPALFSSAMVAGRTSTALHGLHAPEAALHRLLEGTGLIAQKGKGGPADAFVLKVVSAQANAARPSPGPDGLDIDYGGQVQARVWEALCAEARTAPGDYRSLLRFEVDASGRLRQPRLLTSTGDVRRDAAVLEALERVRVGRAPPPRMAQPLTMILLPRDPEHPDGSAQRCDPHGEAPRS